MVDALLVCDLTKSNFQAVAFFVLDLETIAINTIKWRLYEIRTNLHGNFVSKASP
jgi:hypothetical protein